MKLRTIPLVAFVATYGNGAVAHHSNAIFDMTTKVVIRGTITKYEWANPHVYLWVEEVTASGERITWEVEGGPPAILRRSGVSKEQIGVGDEIVIDGNPGRVVDKRQLLMNTLAKGDARTLNFGQANAIASIMSTQETVPVVATSLQGTWASLLDLAVVGSVLNPADTLRTEAGLQARLDIQQGKLPADPYCTPGVLPIVLMAPDIKRIDVADDVIRIAREWDGVEQVIDMNSTSHDGIAASQQGHSIGHWEESTLVVDTARFTANPRGSGYTLPSSEQKHLVERLRLNEAGTHLVYSFVIEDPQYLAQPLVSGEFLWTYRPDLEYAPLPCNRENATRHLR
jgi:hypothetical protein